MPNCISHNNFGCFEDLAAKIASGSRLTFEYGVRLFQSNDVILLGKLADFARVLRLQHAGREQEKDYVYWINNHHLNLTNICEGKCRFCAYRQESEHPKAFFMSLDKALDYIKNNVSKEAKEIHIVSAINSRCNLDYYVELFKQTRQILPNTHIQALTAVEIEYLSRLSGLSVQAVLEKLAEAGLGSIPGGGAEIFAPHIRQQVCPEKIPGEKWLEVMSVAHKGGIKSNATMLTGIGESYEDRLDHMIKIRELQDKTNGFMSFIPLFCHYEGTELKKQTHTGVEIFKTYALSRLMLDNVPHLKAFRIQVGIPLAQLSLAFGVDDIDGTVVEEKITKSAGAKSSQSISKDELLHLIRNAGKIPVERGTLYNVIKVY